MVQVGHNVRIGEHCLVVCQTGFAGSVRVGNYCVFGGRSGAIEHLTVGDRAALATQSVTTKDVPAGVMVSGFPAVEHRKAMRERAAIRKLPALLEQLKETVARVERLEASMHDRM